MDGGAFRLEEVDAVATDSMHLPPLEVANLALPPQSGWREVVSQCLSVGLAAALHVAVLIAMLPSPSDAFGEDGVALETIAVSIVDSLPVISAPETKPAEKSSLQPDADEPQPEAPDETVEAAKEAPKEPEPLKQALALDLPPEPVPPPPEAIALPARKPDAKPDTEVVLREPPPEPTKEEPVKPERIETAAPQPPPLPETAAASEAMSSAEAAPGVVRAYARSVSSVLDRLKPKARGMRGQVKVQFVVDPTGRAEPPRVLSSSGNTRLDDIVVAAIARMEFPPPPPEMNLRQRTFNVPFAYR